jgi:hypothetical protein
MLLLSLLKGEEKGYFLDLLLKIIAFDGNISDVEQSNIINSIKNQLGDFGYVPSELTFDQLLDFFKDKSKVIRNVVFLNVFYVSLTDEWYSAEEHFMIEQVQDRLSISDKKSLELKRLVYAERDLREKVKRVVSE